MRLRPSVVVGLLVLGACADSGGSGDETGESGSEGAGETGEPLPPCPEGPDPQEVGQWGPVIDYSDWQARAVCDEGVGEDCDVGGSRPVAVHAVMLPTRKILIWRNAQAYLYDWESNTLEYKPASFEDVGVCHVNQNRTKFQCGEVSDCFCPPVDPDDEDAEPCSPEDLSCQFIDYSSDIFCAGQTLLEDGRVLAVGGNNGGAYTDGGLRDALIFDPWTKEWELRGTIAEGRWYPSATRMSDGRVFVMGGTNAGAVEVFDVQQSLGQETSIFTGQNANYPWINQEPDVAVRGVLYPFVFQLWDGNIFATGCEDCGDQVQWGGIVFDPTGDGEWFSDVQETKDSTVRGSSGVMYSPGKVMKASGGDGFVIVDFEGKQEPYEKTEVIDLSGVDYLTQAQYEDGGAMNQPRHYANFTLLADGTVAAIGGNTGGTGDYGRCGGEGETRCYPPGDEWKAYSGWSQSVVDACDLSFCQLDPDAPPGTVPLQCENDQICMAFPGQHAPPCLQAEGDCVFVDNEDNATRTTEIWNPELKQWCQMDAQVEARMYHSTSLLLPDGRVISMGSGVRQGLVDKMNAEVYSPPYLFQDGGRPVITAPVDLEEVELGQELVVELDGQAPSGRQISKVAFVAPGATTHQFDMNQRYVPVEDWTVEGDNLRFTVEQDQDVLLPGYYMLFVLSDTGVPSEAPFIRIVRPG